MKGAEYLSKLDPIFNKSQICLEYFNALIGIHNYDTAQKAQKAFRQKEIEPKICDSILKRGFVNSINGKK